MSSIYDAPPEAGDEDRRWAEASRRVRHQLQHGPRVRGISNQLALLVLIVVMGGLAVVTRVGEAVTAVVLWQFGLFAAALVISGVGYIRAKHGGRLLPQIPTSRIEWTLSPLPPEERRSLARQIRGRMPPTEQSRGLISDLIATSQLNNRTALVSVVGLFLFLFLFSESLYLGWPWPLAIVGLVVFIVIISGLEARRWQRALDRIEPTRGS